MGRIIPQTRLLLKNERESRVLLIDKGFKDLSTGYVCGDMVRDIIAVRGSSFYYVTSSEVNSLVIYDRFLNLTTASDVEIESSLEEIIDFEYVIEDYLYSRLTLKLDQGNKNLTLRYKDDCLSRVRLKKNDLF